MRGFVTGVVVSILVLLIGAYLLLQSGLIPANADAEPGGLEVWAAHVSLGATLRREAPTGVGPVALTDANLKDGVKLYLAHCSFCHGTARSDAPPTPLAKGLYPKPPQFVTDGVEDDPEGVTFWKIKHGIRLTGMPAWTGSLSDQQIWTVALFLKHMDKLPPEAETAWKAGGK